MPAMPETHEPDHQAPTSLRPSVANRPTKQSVSGTQPSRAAQVKTLDASFSTARMTKNDANQKSARFSVYSRKTPITSEIESV